MNVVVNLPSYLYFVDMFAIPGCDWRVPVPFLFRLCLSLVYLILVWVQPWVIIIPSLKSRMSLWCWVELECIWAVKTWSKQRLVRQSRQGVSTFSPSYITLSFWMRAGERSSIKNGAAPPPQEQNTRSQVGIDYGDIMSTLWCATIMMIFIKLGTKTCACGCT